MNSDHHHHPEQTNDIDIETTEQRRLADIKEGRDSRLPSNHPINAFSHRKKLGILITLSLSGFLANYSATANQVAFPLLAESFGVAVPLIPQTVGYNLLGLAVGPLFWNPLSKTIGRRPVYLLGSLLFIPCTIWLGQSPNYLSFALARTISGIISSFSQTVPSATVADIFIKEVRGHKMSMYAICVVIGPAIAPFICGAVILHNGWRNIFWIVLGFSVLQFVMFFFLVPETLWNEDETDLSRLSDPVMDSSSAGKEDEQKGIEVEQVEMSGNIIGNGDRKQMEQGRELVQDVKSGHVGAAWMPWHRPGQYFRTCLSPILMLRYITIVIPSFYYGTVFAWSVGITIVLPQSFDKPPFNFSNFAIGCGFLAFAVGGVLGKWSGGLVGDKIVSHLEKKHGYRQPEFRLWALVPVLPFMFAALVIVGATIQYDLHWIAFFIGGGLYYYCLSAATGVLQTYVLEGYLSRSMDTQAVFVFWKCLWGFAIAFCAYEWGLSTGFLVEYITQAALATGMGAVICAVFIWKGYEIRKWQGMPVTERF